MSPTLPPPSAPPLPPPGALGPGPTLTLTIAIPTYNGAARLGKVMEHLQAQQGALDQRWEVIIVDNCSTDDTAAIAAQFQATWQQRPLGAQVPLRYCFEPQPGLAFARQRAIAEARGTWVGFIDDDNWPGADWVASAIAFAQEHHHLGAFGSRIQAVYAVEPPDKFHEIEPFLAIRDHGGDRYPFDPEQLQLPPGAGLVVHRQRWLESVPAKLELVGRLEESWICGEDSAALLYLHRSGHGIAYNPAMTLRHAIPAERLERAYLLPTVYGIGLAICQLRFINVQGPRRWTIAFRTVLGGLRRMIYLLWCHGAALSQDLNLSFHFCFFLGGALSPLIAIHPRLGARLAIQTLRVISQLWPLFPSSFRPTTPPPPSPPPWNPS